MTSTTRTSSPRTMHARFHAGSRAPIFPTGPFFPSSPILLPGPPLSTPILPPLSPGPLSPVYSPFIFATMHRSNNLSPPSDARHDLYTRADCASNGYAPSPPVAMELIVVYPMISGRHSENIVGGMATTAGGTRTAPIGAQSPL